MSILEWLGGIVLFLTMISLLYGLSPKVRLTIHKILSAENKWRIVRRSLQFSKIQCENCGKPYLPRWYDDALGMGSGYEFANCPDCGYANDRELD